MKQPTQEMFENFFRHIKDSSDTMAVDLINSELDENTEWDKIFEKDDEGMGFTLKAEQLDDNLFRIEFGCIVPPDAGDGGVWEVEFAKNGKVLECRDVDEWIA